MHASRTLVIGLLVFVVIVVGTIVEKARQREAAAPQASVTAIEPVTVIDVARGVDAGTLATLVRLRDDERVSAVDDKPVANDFAAGAAITDHRLAAGTYLDLTVTGATGTRRVLVLMH